jgi:polysaccharide biosynthesis transport protein
MLKRDKHIHPLSQANAAQLNDMDEGGVNLGQVGAALRRRGLLIAGITGIAATLAVVKAEQDPPIYQGSFQILTKPVTAEGKVVANVPQSLTQGGGVASPEVESLQTTIAVLQSHRVLDPIVRKLQSKYSQVTYDSIAGSLKISSAKQNILDVQFIHPDEKRVSDVLRLLSDAYLQYSLAERQADVEEAIKFVNKQREPIERRVELWQNQLRNLRLENSLMEPAQKAQEISSHIATLTQQRLDNRVQLEQMVSKYQDLQSEFAQQPGASASNSVLNENPRYQKMLDQIQQLDAEFAKRGSVFTNEEEGMQRLQEQKAAILSSLNDERSRVNRDFQSRIRELESRDRSLDEKIRGLDDYIRRLATITRNYDNIQGQLKIATQSMDQFTTKQQALQIEKSQKQQPWSLLDPQLTKVGKPDAISASTKKNLLLGGMLGLLLGVGAALVVDKLSNIFYTSKELKEVTRLPLLGVVPLRKELAGLVNKENVGTNRSTFFEVFRSLYTNILLLGSDSPIRSLVISSPAQGDGKSTIAIQLAQAAAAMGQKVLLVDANLRCPTLHNRVGLMNIQGLTDVISQDLDWNNVIERSRDEDNLYVMTAGPIPPDSVRLLASQKMQDLMDNLQATFDLVIYDTPPLLGFADAYLLSANTNGMVLVAGLGKLKRTVLQQTLEEIQVSGTPILGMIANKSKESTPTSYSYYQQYYEQSMNAEATNEDAEYEMNNSTSKSSSHERIKRR